MDEKRIKLPSPDAGPQLCHGGIHTSEQLAETKYSVPCPGEVELSKKRFLASVFVESQEEEALLRSEGSLWVGVGTGKAALNGS